MPLKIASKNFIAQSLRDILAYVETEAKPNKHVVVAALHRVKMALSETAQEAVQAMGPLQANSREEVMKGFKESNPSLTKDQLEEIADHWEKNKDVVKGKH
jgi:CRISPR/Cas system CSM-associated protein Csm5 (group 7 of RAMP superfamily)